MMQRQYDTSVCRNIKWIKHDREFDINFIKHVRLLDHVDKQTTQKPRVMVQEKVSSRAGPLASRGTPFKVDPGSKIKE